jgi:hypothetical protein
MGERAIDWRTVHPAPVTCVEVLPESLESWAEMLSLHAFNGRPANDIPEPLPSWIADSPERVTFLRGAPLSNAKIAGMVRSRSMFAVRVRETAEAMVSEYDASGGRPRRTLTFQQCQRLLLHLLPLADRAQEVRRSFLDSVKARVQDLRRTPSSKRRAELLDLYRAMLRHGLPLDERDLYGEDRHLTARERRIRREVEADLRDVGRPRHMSSGTNPHQPNRDLWDPPFEPAPVKRYRVQHEPMFATKNAAVPNGYSELPTSADSKYVEGFGYTPNN